MDRNDMAEDGIVELGIASVETLGTRLPYPEVIGFDLEPQGAGISLD